MENPVPLPPQPSRKIAPPASALILIILQALSLLGFAYVLGAIFEPTAGTGFFIFLLVGGLPFVLICLGLGIGGIVQAVRLFRTKNSWALLLLATSAFMTTVYLPFQITRMIAKEFVQPFAYSRSAERYQNLKRKNYDLLTERFKTPQKVLAIKGTEWLLEDNIVIRGINGINLGGVDSSTSLGGMTNCDNWYRLGFNNFETCYDKHSEEIKI